MAENDMRKKDEQVLLMWGGPREEDKKEPVVLRGLEGIHVKQIVCAAGRNEELGYIRAYILSHDGKVYQWGPSQNWASVPHKNRLVSSESLIEEPIAQLASGYHQFAAVSNAGNLYTWGRGAFGMLGHGNQHDQNNPKKVDALDGIHIVQAACLADSTAVLSADGRVYAFGSNLHGCNGNGRSNGEQRSPTVIEGLPLVDSISAFCYHAAAISKQGKLYTWGLGDCGCLGHPEDVNIIHTPKQVNSLERKSITQVSCGSWHTAVLTSDGKVYTFGNNAYGKLGVGGGNIKQLTPKLVEQLRNEVISQVACGENRTSFLSSSHGLSLAGKHELGSDLQKEVQSFRGYKIKHVYLFDRYTIVYATRKPSPHSLALKSMVNVAEFSDVAFEIGEDKVFAHKIILVRQSEYFRNMFSSGMQESTNAVVKLSGIKKSTLLLVLEYLYVGVVVVPVSSAIDLFLAADMYGIQGLKQMCRESLFQHLTTDNAAQLLLQTAEFDVEDLRTICFAFVLKNFEAVSKTDAMTQVSENAALALELMRAVSKHRLE